MRTVPRVSGWLSSRWRQTPAPPADPNVCPSCGSRDVIWELEDEGFVHVCGRCGGAPAPAVPAETRLEERPYAHIAELQQERDAGESGSSSRANSQGCHRRRTRSSSSRGTQDHVCRPLWRALPGLADVEALEAKAPASRSWT
jgi:hypothetical protein